MAKKGFFQRQAEARRNTSLLVAMFLGAVALITLSVCFVGYYATRSDTTHLAFTDWLLSNHGLYTAVAVIALILSGSVFRWIDLAGGGHRVAKMVGARAVDPATQDMEERQLRNVVEEMAIASGISVPDLYVMDHETGINAFVAGYTPGEAVMVVTHGTLTQLTRDELQGVVAHEFSHILNGDMRINVRLIAVLAGILMIGQVGSFLLRATFYRGTGSSRDSRGQAALGIVGLALIVIGYIGVFSGRLIQSGVSRQREMLADASSVQFTRNPEGIAGALYKIGAKTGYLDTTSHASDMNHMCFTESARMKLSSLLASHPPIEKRIEAIQPGMLARLRSRLRDTTPSRGLNRDIAPTSAEHAVQGAAVSSFSSGGTTTSPLNQQGSTGAVSERVGQVDQASEAFAQTILNQLPSTFRNLLYTRAGAVQLCYAVLASREQTEALNQLQARGLFEPNTDILGKLWPSLQLLGDSVRLPALELAMPALRKLDPEERAELIGHCEALVTYDRRVNLFELSMISFLKKHLAGDAARVVNVKYRRYSAVIPKLEALFSLMARMGAETPEEQQTLFESTMAGFHSGSTPQMQEKTTLKQLRDAMWHLNHLSPLLKPAIIDSASHCVLADGEIKASEYELIRLLADQLDCPMPPLKL